MKSSCGKYGDGGGGGGGILKLANSASIGKDV